MAASGIPDGRGDWLEGKGSDGRPGSDGREGGSPDDAGGAKAGGAAWATKPGAADASPPPGGDWFPPADDRTRDDLTGDDPTREDLTGDDPTRDDPTRDYPTREGRVGYLQPLTNELIAAVLDARGYRYSTDSDGDIGGRWDNHLIYFFRFGTDGEVLQVRILVGHTFATADVPRLYAFCNEWNHDRLWPKAYVHVYDDGVVRVCGEVMADLTAGVAFDQLDQLIECGIETGLHMAEAVDELQDA